PPRSLRADRGGREAAARSSILDVDALGLAALLALDHAERDLLTFGERVETGAGQRRAVHEHVLAAVVDRDEAEALRGIVPLHGAAHLHRRAAGETATAAATTAVDA